MQFTFKKFLILTGITVLLFIGWFVWQLFGPAPPIVVSKATTYITAPLRPNGLPDYEQYVLEQMRDGVTPENNAAVPFWQAMGPGDDFEPGEFELMAEEIGLEQIPAEDEYLQEITGKEIRERVIAWLRQEGVLAQNEEEDFERFGDPPWSDADEASDELIFQAMDRPWKSAQIPPLAQWIADNEKPLNLLVAASKRPRFYSPSATLLDDSPDSLLAMLLPGAQTARDAARALSARAMWHLGEGQSAEAWDNVLALYRLSRLVAQGGTLVEQLVSIAIEGITNQSTLAILNDPKVPVEVLRQIQADLAALGRRESIADTFNSVERLSILDALLSLRNGSADDLGIAPAQAALLSAAIDWNIPLRILNEHYDKLAAAANISEWVDRKKAMEAHEVQLKQLEQSINWQRAAGGLVSRNVRSAVVGDIFAALMLPATSAAMAAEDRANTYLTLTQLAAALAIYRAEHGEYPEKLEALVPDVLDKLPADLFHDNPFAYRRTKNGYLLYSLGPNGQDDGGSSEMMNRFKGLMPDEMSFETLQELLGEELPLVADESAEPDPDSGELPKRPFTAEDDLYEQIPSDSDDFSIRLPLPKLELPKPK